MQENKAEDKESGTGLGVKVKVGKWAQGKADAQKTAECSDKDQKLSGRSDDGATKAKAEETKTAFAQGRRFTHAAIWNAQRT